MDIWEITLRIALGLALGSAIGLERQWRARMAGLRTNALVSVGATLFVVMGAYSFAPGEHSDPTRVAAQVVSGIGFLGAGVIMKQGATITGINTAATLWSTAAIGALAGSGMYLPATIGAAIILAANTLLRPIGRMMDKHTSKVGREIPPADYLFEVSCSEEAEAHIRSLTVSAISRPEFQLREIRSSHNPEDGDVDVVARLTARERDDSLLEEAVNRLSLEPLVTHVGWSVHSAESEDTVYD